MMGGARPLGFMRINILETNLMSATPRADGMPNHHLRAAEFLGRASGRNY